VTVVSVAAMTSEECRRERARQVLRGELCVDLERIELHERKVERFGERLHHHLLGEALVGLAWKRKLHRGEDLGGVNHCFGAHCAPAWPLPARPKELCPLAIFVNHGVARLLLRHEATLHEQSTHRFERERRLGHVKDASRLFLRRWSFVYPRPASERRKG